MLCYSTKVITTFGLLHLNIQENNYKKRTGLIILNAVNNKKKMLTTFAAAAVAVTAGTTIATTTTTAHAATRVDDNTVRVEQGDNLSKVAQQFGTSVDQLVQVNGISNPNLILTGQQLKLSGNGTAVTTPAVQAATTVTTQNTNNNAYAQTTQTQQAQATTNANNASTQASQSTTALSGGEQAAKDWIAARESGGNYGATNGNYIGKYQLSAAYLNGDYSPANQERVANNYVASRYGSWTAAQQFWQSHGWY